MTEPLYKNLENALAIRTVAQRTGDYIVNLTSTPPSYHTTPQQVMETITELEGMLSLYKTSLKVPVKEGHEKPDGSGQ